VSRGVLCRRVCEGREESEQQPEDRPTALDIVKKRPASRSLAQALKALARVRMAVSSRLLDQCSVSEVAPSLLRCLSVLLLLSRSPARALSLSCVYTTESEHTAMEGRGGGGGAIRRGRHEYRTNKPYERVRPHTHSLHVSMPDSDSPCYPCSRRLKLLRDPPNLRHRIMTTNPRPTPQRVARA